MAGTSEPKMTEKNYMFTPKVVSGEVILTSRQHRARKSAEDGIVSVHANAPHDGRSERKISTAGDPSFHPQGDERPSHRGQPDGFPGLARGGGIVSMKGTAPDATLKDLTTAIRPVEATRTSDQELSKNNLNVMLQLFGAIV